MTCQSQSNNYHTTIQQLPTPSHLAPNKHQATPHLTTTKQPLT